MVVHVETEIKGTPEKVWEGLTDAGLIKKYTMGADVESAWKTGSKISWKGSWKGKTFEDHGEVLDAIPNKLLKYSHVSQANNGPGAKHIVTINLSKAGNVTHLELDQENNSSEKEVTDSQKNWQMMLDGLKKVVEESK